VDVKPVKIFWFALGVILLGIAYIGLIMPGIPWSTPTVAAAYCFAKSSDRMHRWLYSHRIFGPFLIGWQEKRIFPTKAKYLMLVTMATSLAVMWFTTGNLVAIGYVSIFMLVCVIWGWRYPGSEEEYEKRVKEGRKIAWLR
jgi:uncharacterized membrane protein YbaN (DUF454 family)